MTEQSRAVDTGEAPVGIRSLGLLFICTCISSWLAHHLTLPPVSLAPIDPSGGIALAATLLWGRRAALTVGIATWAGWLATGVASTLMPLVLSLTVALQALLGATLIRRALPGKLELTEPRDIVSMMVLGGVLACGASALLAVLAFASVGRELQTPLVEIGATWWVVQVLSVCTAAPATLAWIASPTYGWAERRATVGFTLALAIGLLALLVARVARNDSDRLRAAFEHEAISATSLLNQHLREPLDALEAVHSIFTAGREVSRDGFAIAAQTWLEGPGSQRALSYNERVAPQDVDAFESRMHADGLPTYKIHDRYQSLQLHLTPGEDLYAIKFIAPAQWNNLLGLNSMSTTVARDSILATIRSGKPQATALFQLAAAPNSSLPARSGIVAYQAVYSGAPRTESERSAMVKGVATTTLRPDLTLETVTDSLSTALQLCLMDVSSGARQRIAGPPDCQLAQSNPGFTRTDSIEFAGRQWELSVYARNPSLLPGARTGDAWWIVVAGLIAISLLGTLLLIVSGRTAQIQLAMTEARRARAAADVANAAKGEFLAKMSHEIRTPMNAITGMCYLVLRAGLSPQQHAYVTKAQRAAQSLLGVIDDILDFSKIEAGKMAVENVEFKLADVLDTVIDVLVLKADDRNIELLVDESPGLPQVLIGDPLRLTQVLVNLGGNAVKFTNQGEVVLGIEHLGSDGASVTLRFSVADTGVGLTKEQSERVFQPFEQADASTTRRHGGTGLGLPISRQLLRLMGSDLAVSSEPGRGTEFAFVLQHVLPASLAESAMPPESNLQGVRLLFVDDNSKTRSIVARMAESMEMQVELAVDGDDALRIVTAAALDRPFDIAIIKWNMSGMDGLSCATRLAAVCTPLRIVITTPMSSRELLREAIAKTRAPIDDILVKPVVPPALHAACMAVLHQPERSNAIVSHADAASGSSQSDLQGSRVLVVEDNEINAELATALLKLAGVVVTTAPDGRAALACLRQEKFDAVLMDCQMPEMDGYEATRAIRSDLRLTDLPIIAMTANAMSDDRVKALAAGMNDHIAKPIDVPSMYATLTRWIRR